MVRDRGGACFQRRYAWGGEGARGGGGGCWGGGACSCNTMGGGWSLMGDGVLVGCGRGKDGRPAEKINECVGAGEEDKGCCLWPAEDFPGPRIGGRHSEGVIQVLCKEHLTRLSAMVRHPQQRARHQRPGNVTRQADRQADRQAGMIASWLRAQGFKGCSQQQQG